MTTKVFRPSFDSFDRALGFILTFWQLDCIAAMTTKVLRYCFNLTKQIDKHRWKVPLGASGIVWGKLPSIGIHFLKDSLFTLRRLKHVGKHSKLGQKNKQEIVTAIEKLVLAQSFQRHLHGSLPVCLSVDTFEQGHVFVCPQKFEGVIHDSCTTFGFVRVVYIPDEVELQKLQTLWSWSCDSHES